MGVREVEVGGRGERRGEEYGGEWVVYGGEGERR